MRPGYLRGNVAGNTTADLQISAAKSDDDSTVVVVAINKGSAPAEEPITIVGGSATSCTPHVTSASDNLVAGTAIPVTDGVFSASLAATTVTSFVCQ
jgi:glucuronoarabinoxylan endo-1,4-beta-xylanase